jgi:hypothetical protein
LQNFDDPPMGAQVTAVELHLITGHWCVFLWVLGVWNLKGKWNALIWLLILLNKIKYFFADFLYNLGLKD